MLFVIERGSQKHKWAKVQIQSEERTSDLIIKLEKNINLQQVEELFTSSSRS